MSNIFTHYCWWILFTFNVIIYSMKKNIKKIIGDYIVSCRKEAGYNQSRFADKSDIVINTLSKIERGESDLRFSSLQMIVNGLEMSLTEFFRGFEQFEANDNPDLKKLFNLLKDEDDETIKKVVQQTEMLLSFKNKK